MAKTEDWFGLAGVAWLSGLLFLSLALVVYWACRRQAEPAVAALLVVLTLIASTSGISMRPQMVSYILVVVTIAAWQRARDTGRAPWLLVPADVGLDDVPRDVADRDRDRRRRSARARPRPRSSTPHPGQDGRGAGAVGSGLAAHARRSRPVPGRAPRGLPGQVLLRVEPARLHQALGRHAGRHPGAGRGTQAAARRAGAVVRRPAGRARGAVRHLLDAHRAGGGLPRRSRSLRPPYRRSSARGPRCSAASGCSSSAGPCSRWPRSRSWCRTPRTSRRETPPWLDGALGDLPAGTRVINDSGFGGYLMWRFPELDVVVHGYGDLYTDDELERNADIEGGRAGWVDLVQNTGADVRRAPAGLAARLQPARGRGVESRRAQRRSGAAAPTSGVDGRAASRRSRRPSARASPRRHRSRRPRGPGRSRRPAPRRSAPPARRTPPARRRR